MDLHKIGIKFYASAGSDIPLVDFIPVFHRWIQQSLLDDVLIDVADYSHVYASPGTLLIAHEGNYGIDETDNRRGLVYYSKHPLTGELPDRIATVCRKALAACSLLEQEEHIRDKLVFDYSSVRIYANDRLHGPNTEDGYQSFEPAIKSLLDRLYASQDYQLEREQDPRERLSVMVKATGAPGTATELLQKLK